MAGAGLNKIELYIEKQLNMLYPEFNSTKKEKRPCDRFKKQDILAFKNDIKSSHITEAVSKEYLS